MKQLQNTSWIAQGCHRRNAEGDGDHEWTHAACSWSFLPRESDIEKAYKACKWLWKWSKQSSIMSTQTTLCGACFTSCLNKFCFPGVLPSDVPVPWTTVVVLVSSPGATISPTRYTGLQWSPALLQLNSLSHSKKKRTNKIKLYMVLKYYFIVCFKTKM